MREIPLTKGYIALVDDEDYERVSAFKWTALVAKRKDRTVVYGRHYPKRDGKPQMIILLHRFIIDAPKGMDVDHRDGNGLHCWRTNLRVATRSQNLANNRHLIGASGFRGVFIHPKWKPRARISVGNKTKYIGSFPTIEDAARAYDHAAIQEYGEFARLNFPHEHGHAAPTAGNMVNGKQ